MADLDIDVESHAETTRLDVHELVRRLIGHLGPTLVATVANVNDPKLPYKWAKAAGPEPRQDTYARLIAAHRAWAMISNAESDSTARAWFIGANPRLGEEAPALRLREGDIQSVLLAAKAFIEGTDD